MSNYRMNWQKLLSNSSSRKRNRIKASDIRNDFEKDYHRIISSASFRRLQDKTQVFPLEENDFVRTRLTHSIEVSSFAKSIGQSVASKIYEEKLDDDFDFMMINDISNILSSAGLIHDIGNPPFGHFGEDAIRIFFKNNMDKIKIKDANGEEKLLIELFNDQMQADLYNFEGNAQTIRIVSKLHFKVDEKGMNLTYGLLNTVIKYPISSLDIDKLSGNIKDKKMGYYLSEKDLFYDIVKTTGTYDKKNKKIYRHPLTYLLEAADDIAYATADVEDAIKKKIFNYDNILEALKENDCFDDNVYYDRLIKYKEDAINSGYYNPKDYAAQRWIISIQGLIIKDCVQNFINNYEDIMNGEFKEDLFYNTKTEEILKALKNLAKRYIFDSPAITKMEIAASNMIEFFLHKFINSILYFDTEYEDKLMTNLDHKYIRLLSDNHIYMYKYYADRYELSKQKEMEELIKKDNIENTRHIERLNEEYKKEIYNYKLYLRILLVTDNISGMTDNYIKTLYQELVAIK